jgi:sugar lactone lactonase YvrE
MMSGNLHPSGPGDGHFILDIHTRHHQSDDFNYKKGTVMMSKYYHRIVLSVLTLLLTISISKTTQANNTSAAQRGIPGDSWADIVIGQPDFSQITPNEVVGNKLFNPGGVYVDRSVQPNRVYVYDAGNSRILGFSSLGTCQAGINRGQSCTSQSDCPGSTCQIEESRAADFVLGQPDFGSSACNGDSGFQDYPTEPQADADTLCGQRAMSISIAEAGAMATMSTDDNGNFYVTDLFNHRVLRYNNPFTTDNIADYVWGQENFTSNTCNRGASYGYPDDKSLCLAPLPGFGDLKSGVDIDPQGNLWVADTQNNRVLRFPDDIDLGVPAQQADLVLGQPNFTTAMTGNSLDQMDKPASVRLDNSGTLYVADSLNNRVLVFEPPFSNGMSASSLLGVGMNAPTGLETDPIEGIWVNDCENLRVLHFVNDVLQDTIDSVPQRAWGGIGIDRDSNVMVTGWDSQQVLVYTTPNYDWEATFLLADEYGSFNSLGPRGVDSGIGMEVTDHQLIYADGSRLLFWNQTWDLANFQAASGVIGQPDFFTRPKWDPRYGRMRADQSGLLWVTKGLGWTETKILAYQLPLVTGAEPLITLSSPLPLKGGGEFAWTGGIQIEGIDIQPGCDCLWLSDPDYNRVFRIKDVSSPQPEVDIVLGQLDINGIHCNQGRDSDDGYIHPQYPSQDSLCHPGALSFDHAGNLFVADHNLEVAGNWRLLEYDAGSLPASPDTAVFGIPATHVFGRNNDFTEPNCLADDTICGPWEPAFDSQRRMVLGFNGYLGSRFLNIYDDILNNPIPQSVLSDFYSHPMSVRFDQLDNLYVLDHTRNRVLIYLNHPAYRLYIPLTINN